MSRLISLIISLIVILLTLFFLFVLFGVFDEKQNSENYEDSISKQELRDKVTILFKKLEEEDNRHKQELNKIYEGLKTALSLSLDPEKTLKEKPEIKKSDVCKFMLKDKLFDKVIEMYNKHKSNPNFEMIQLYQRPIGNQSYEFDNKIKTYVYTYKDNTFYPNQPFYKTLEKKELYGNITVKFDDKCKVKEFISINENVYKEYSKEVNNNNDDY